MSTEQIAALKARLKAAEDVCVMYAWSPSRHESDREKATYELWLTWLNIVGDDFMLRQNHPDLSDERVGELAWHRDQVRSRTLAAIFKS